jgi:hydrogenase nickel incorporation protein HypB
MCDVCGCVGGTGHVHIDGHVHIAGAVLHTGEARNIEVLQAMLQDNDHQAAHNRAHFDAAGVLVVNLMSSPGAGKTSLLEATIRALRGRLRIAVIEGDLETENDARRIRAAGAPAVQVTTGSACHLDATMVHAALHTLDLRQIDVLFIENVGNLVCPAAFDLGQHRNVVLLSVTEGDDKPEKYPVMFRAADMMCVTKLDLMDAVGDFAPDRAIRHLRDLASAAPVLQLSARNGHGLDQWLGWITDQLASRSQTDAAVTGERQSAVAGG